MQIEVHVAAVPCPTSAIVPQLRHLACTTFTPHPDRACCAIRFGTEHEKLGYYVSSLKRLEYSAIQQLLEGLVSRYSWAPIMEGTYIIGAEKDGQSVTIEPGGQFELSGAPLASLHDTDAETHSHLDQVRRWLPPASVFISKGSLQARAHAHVLLARQGLRCLAFLCLVPGGGLQG